MKRSSGEKAGSAAVGSSMPTPAQPPHMPESMHPSRLSATVMEEVPLELVRDGSPPACLKNRTAAHSKFGKNMLANWAWVCCLNGNVQPLNSPPGRVTFNPSQV